MHKLGLGVLVLEGRLLLVVELRRLLEGNMLLHLGCFSTIDLIGRNRLKVGELLIIVLEHQLSVIDQWALLHAGSPGWY